MNTKTFLPDRSEIDKVLSVGEMPSFKYFELRLIRNDETKVEITTRITVDRNALMESLWSLCEITVKIEVLICIRCNSFDFAMWLRGMTDE